jgi:glutamine amidotransferase
LNFIASDGRKLYALRYAKESLSYHAPYYLKRPTEGLRLERLSKETYQLVGAKLATGEKAVVVASEPLTEEPCFRHLLVLMSYSKMPSNLTLFLSHLLPSTRFSH